MPGLIWDSVTCVLDTFLFILHLTTSSWRLQAHHVAVQEVRTRTEQNRDLSLSASDAMMAYGQGPLSPGLSVWLLQHSSWRYSMKACWINVLTLIPTSCPSLFGSYTLPSSKFHHPCLCPPLPLPRMPLPPSRHPSSTQVGSVLPQTPAPQAAFLTCLFQITRLRRSGSALSLVLVPCIEKTLTRGLSNQAHGVK